jgi:predicted DNA-binding transcriptional regulator AlpA
VSDALDALLAALADVPADELPEAIGALESAKARAWARLTTQAAPGMEPRGSGDGAALDVDEVAHRTGMSVQWLYRQARAGHLPFARRIGRRLVFDPAGLARWLARRPPR